MTKYLLESPVVRVAPPVLHALLPHQEVGQVDHPVPVVIHAGEKLFGVELPSQVRQHASNLFVNHEQSSRWCG